MTRLCLPFFLLFSQTGRGAFSDFILDTEFLTEFLQGTEF